MVLPQVLAVWLPEQFAFRRLLLASSAAFRTNYLAHSRIRAAGSLQAIHSVTKRSPQGLRSDHQAQDDQGRHGGPAIPNPHRCCNRNGREHRSRGNGVLQRCHHVAMVLHPPCACGWTGWQKPRSYARKRAIGRLRATRKTQKASSYRTTSALSPSTTRTSPSRRVMYRMLCDCQ